MGDVTACLKTSGIWDAVLALKAEDMFVADPDVLKALEEHATCRLACRNEALDCTGMSGRIVVMLRNKEWIVCRKLRNQNQEASVLSLTYDLLPNGLKQGFQYSPITDQSELPDITLYIMPYGADIPYILRLLENAKGLGVPNPFLAKSSIWWIAEIKDLSIPRLFNAVLKRDDQNSKLYWVDYGLLLSLQGAASLSAEKMRSFLESYISKIIYFLRRDKCEQAVMLSATEPQGMSSLWDAERKIIKELVAPAYSFHHLFETVQMLVALEASVESMIEGHENLRVLTQEDLAFNPVAVLGDLSMFVGGRVAMKMKSPDYTARYAEVKNLYENVQLLKDDLVKELGLVKNAAGSYVPEMSRLLKQKA